MNRIKEFFVKTGDALLLCVLYLATAFLLWWLEEQRFGGALSMQVNSVLLLMLLGLPLWWQEREKAPAATPRAKKLHIAFVVLMVGCTGLCLFMLYRNWYELIWYQYLTLLLTAGGLALYRKKKPLLAERKLRSVAVCMVLATFIASTLLYLAAVNPCTLQGAKEQLADDGYGQLDYLSATEERENRFLVGEGWEPLGTYCFTAEKQGAEYLVFVSVLNGGIVESNEIKA